MGVRERAPCAALPPGSARASQVLVGAPGQCKPGSTPVNNTRRRRSLAVDVYIHIYTSQERERERERVVKVIYIYIPQCDTYTYI